MALTPVELRHVSLPRQRFFGGYRRGPVDRLVTDIADSFEEVWRERADFADQIEHLEDELARHRELETLLRTTLVSAERAAHELKDQAKREAQLVVDEAHAEARAITRRAAVENERLRVESLRMRERLLMALASIDEELDEGPAADAEAA
jgi:cell division initiation protein